GLRRPAGPSRLDAGDSGAPRDALRRGPLPRRLPAFPAVPPEPPAPPDHPARAAGPAGSRAPLPRVPRLPGGLHFRLAARAAALGNAMALLFPIDWPEPFGLAMIEALACGTPVIAYRQGSVPEILDHGVTGFIVEGLEDALRAVERIGEISRRRCRQVFEQRF